MIENCKRFCFFRQFDCILIPKSTLRNFSILLISHRGANSFPHGQLFGVARNKKSLVLPLIGV